MNRKYFVIERLYFLLSFIILYSFIDPISVRKVEGICRYSTAIVVAPYKSYIGEILYNTIFGSYINLLLWVLGFRQVESIEMNLFGKYNPI